MIYLLEKYNQFYGSNINMDIIKYCMKLWDIILYMHRSIQ